MYIVGTIMKIMCLKGNMNKKLFQSAEMMNIAYTL